MIGHCPVCGFGSALTQDERCYAHNDVKTGVRCAGTGEKARVVVIRNRGTLHNEVLQAVKRGATDQQIGAMYGISEATVKAVRENNNVKPKQGEH